MSMTNEFSLVSSLEITDLKNKYLELIADGKSEKSALEELGFPKVLYMKLLLDDSDFVASLDQARKVRADIWVGKIMESVDDVPDKDDVGGERLKFDKLQFLAKADNPDKYSGKQNKIDVDINLKQFKLLSPVEAMEALKSDPFAIPAESTIITDEDLL